MTKEKTKHKFHEVLKWIADGEQLEYKNDFDEWVSTLNEAVLSAITCTGDSYYTVGRFRIKPEITTKTIQGTFFLSRIKSGYHTSTLELETFKCINARDFDDLNRCLVRIISDEWYNELVSCKEQLDKLKF